MRLARPAAVAVVLSPGGTAGGRRGIGAAQRHVAYATRADPARRAGAAVGTPGRPRARTR
jgi:hypothetical protein